MRGSVGGRARLFRQTIVLVGAKLQDEIRRDTGALRDLGVPAGIGRAAGIGRLSTSGVREKDRLQAARRFTALER